METAQTKFDALIAEFGAGVVIAAIKGHKKPNTDGGTTCTKDSDCGHGYICSGGSCVLDIG